MTDCVFCKIANAEAPAQIVFENDACVCFVPLNPVTEGHVLAIPRAHVPSALASPEWAGITMRVAAEYAKHRKYEGVNFITSCGEVATQSIFHLHIHIVPRRERDGLMLPWTGQITNTTTYVHNDDGVSSFGGG